MVKFAENSLLSTLAFYGGPLLGVILLLLLYKLIKKLGCSIGPWLGATAILIGVIAGCPIILVYGDVFLHYGCFYMIAFAVAAVVVNKLALKSVKKAESDRKAKIDFYNKCVSLGVTSLETEKDIARAQAVAKEFSVPNDVDIKSFFAESKDIVEQIIKQNGQQKKIQEQNEIRNQEHRDHEQFSRYFECRENEKTIKILEQSLQQKIKEKNDKESFQRRASAVMLEKEKDWASLGGAASAIGGTAAGVAVALDVQAKNAEIRARNAQTSANLSQMQFYIDRSLGPLSCSIDDLKQKIAKEKTKLTKKITKEEALEHLSITVDSVNISETGAFRVHTSLKLKKTMVIFDDVSARIDGGFSCFLLQNNKVVGEAKLVLPLYGLQPETKSSLKVQGICLKGANPDVPYKVSVVLDNLWAIEN